MDFSLVCRLTGHRWGVYVLDCWEKEGHCPLLFSGSGDRSVKVWDLDSFNEVGSIRERFDIRALCVDNDIIYVGDYGSNMIKVYSIPSLEQKSSFEIKGAVFDIKIDNNYVYIATWNYNIEVMMVLCILLISFL